MASDRPVFLRPVEIVAPLNAAPNDCHFEITDDNGANWWAITIPSGVYASVLTLCYAIEKQTELALGVGEKIQVRPYVDIATHEFHIFFAKTAAQIKLNFKPGAISETALRDMLGFNSDLCPPIGPGGASLHASFNFGNAWFPYRTPSDREGFQKDQAALFAGIRTSQGQLAGIGTGTARYTREFALPMEPVVNVLEQFCTNEYETARCAEKFFEECRTAQINISSHDNPRGFWFVPDVTYLHQLSQQSMRVSAKSGIHFHYSTPHRWTFCVPDPRGPRAFPVAMNRGQAYYNVDFAAHTADAPSFTISDALA